jgi:hypothetical protein
VQKSQQHLVFRRHGQVADENESTAVRITTANFLAAMGGAPIAYATHRDQCSRAVAAAIKRALQRGSTAGRIIVIPDQQTR